MSDKTFGEELFEVAPIAFLAVVFSPLWLPALVVMLVIAAPAVAVMRAHRAIRARNQEVSNND